MSLSSHAVRRFSGPLLGVLCVVSAGTASGQQTYRQPILVQGILGSGSANAGGADANWPAAVYSADMNGDGYPDLIYIDQGATAQSSTVHVLLNNGVGGFTDQGAQTAAGNELALGDFAGDGTMRVAWIENFASQGQPLFDLFLSAAGGSSGVRPAGAPFPAANGTTTARFAYLTAAHAHTTAPGTNPVDYLVFEDTVAGVLYVYTTSTAHGVTTFHEGTAMVLPDGAGPIAVADLNGDGVDDLVIVSPATGTADVLLGRGDGTYFAPVEYACSGVVRSVLLADMDGDGHPDLIAEGAKGRIDIYHGNGDGSFEAASEGGSGALDGTTGNGGHLVAVGKLGNDTNLDILTATPIGISALLGQGLQGQGGLTYKLGGIYNAGPGRSYFALAGFMGSGWLDLAVDSPQGIALLPGLRNGGFDTSLAYSALAPALGSVVGRFRNAQNNPGGNLDVVVNTGAAQGQLLAGAGDGTFTTFANPTNTSAGPSGIPANLWSTLASGDFNGDGNADLAYSLAGLPLAGPGAVAGLYVQYGNGDGTFAAPVAVAGAEGSNTLYGESAVGDFNGDGVADIANADAVYDDTLLGNLPGPLPYRIGLNRPDSNNTAFNLVASGFFAPGRSNKQDLIFQEGANFIPYLNSGDGVHFTRMPALANPQPPIALTAATLMLADVDGDGKGDAIAVYHSPGAQPGNVAGANSTGANSTGASSEVYIWYGNGDGTFGNPISIALSRNHYLGAVAAMVPGGLPDLVLSDGDVVTILYNLGARSFGNLPNRGEEDLLAGQGINSLSVQDVNGDGVPDIVVANGGATQTNAIAMGAAAAGVTGIALTPNADVNTGGITVLLGSAAAMLNQPSATASATGTDPTTTLLYLCVGPTVLCPSTGSVTAPAMPPAYPTSLSMSYGQTFNGVVQAEETDGIALTGTIEFDDTYNGVLIVPPLCILQVNIAFACPTSVGTTLGTSVGTNVFSATYSGDATHASSSAAPVTIAVLPDVVTGTLTGAPNPSPQGQLVTFTAIYMGNYAAPTGPVTFAETFPPTTVSLLLGTAQLVPGPGLSSTATFTTSSLPVGSDTIETGYQATMDFAGAAAGPYVEVITPLTPGSFTLSVTPNPVTTGVGLGSILTVTVTPQNGFAQTVNLACGNLPYEVTCLLSAPSIAAGGGPVSLFFSTSAPHSCGTTEPYFTGSNGGSSRLGRLALPALAGLLAIFLPGKRRRRGRRAKRPWLRALVAVALAAGAMQVSGCGNCTDLGTKPGTYTFTVTGTASATGEVQAQSVTLNVTI